VDALAVIGATLGGGAVQLPVAGMGNDPRLRGVWGRADPGLLVGSAIVVASGLYILWRETLRRRRPAVPAPQRVVPASSGNAGSQTLTLLMGGVSSTEEGIRDNPSNPFRAGGDAPARDEHYICSCKCWLKIKRT
jgi:hypothetical protein